MPTAIGFLLALAAAPGGGRELPLMLTESLTPARFDGELAQAGEQGPQRLPLYPSLSRRFELKVGGGLYSNFDTALAVNSDVLLGARLDLEDTLGIDGTKSLLRVDAEYAFSPRHELHLGAFDISRAGSRTINEDIEFGDVTIPAGSVDTEFGTTIVKLSYLYNFVAEHRTKIGVSAGLHTMTIDTSLSTTSGSVSESFDAIAPLPVFGLHAEYALSRRWRMLASAEFFQLDIGQARGHLTDTLLGFEHDLFDHVGWGLAFNGFNMDATIEGDGPLTADLVYQYQGLLLYLRAYW